MADSSAQSFADNAARRPALPRDPQSAAKESWDAIIIGGGIQGIALLLEAGRRGLRALLLEQNDFGGATTWNHLRTLHGGLRYLQSFDLPRFFESVAERRWFLQRYPSHTRPLPCLMPLYGDGLRKPAIVRVAAWLNDSLSLRRNEGVAQSHHLPATRVVPSAQVQAIFPKVRADGLKGGVVWHDAITASPQRLVMALLRDAVAAGGIALNYVRALAFLSACGKIAGVRARDEVAGAELEFRAPVVVVAAGPWGPLWLREQGQPAEDLFPGRLLLWNVLFDHPQLSDHALALSPRPGGHTYFVHGWEGLVLAGTGERATSDEPSRAAPTPDDLRQFIADLRAASSGLDLREDQILRVYYGILPATRSGQLTRRPVLVDHGRRGGLRGLYSVSGIKFTTARRTAERVLRLAFPDRRPRPWETLPLVEPRASADMALSAATDGKPEDFMRLAALARDEAAIHLSDLLLRRTDLGERPDRARALAPALVSAMGFSRPAAKEELLRLERELACALPHLSANIGETADHVCR